MDDQVSQSVVKLGLFAMEIPPHIFAEVRRQADEAGMSVPVLEKAGVLTEQFCKKFTPAERNLFIAIGRRDIQQFKAVAFDAKYAIHFAALMGFQEALDFYWENKSYIPVPVFEMAIMTHRPLNIVLDEIDKPVAALGRTRQDELADMEAAIIRGCEYGRLDVVEHFIRESLSLKSTRPDVIEYFKRDDEHAENPFFTCMWNACHYGHEKIVRYLIENDFLSQIELCDITRLMEDMCIHGRRNILRLFIKNKEQFMENISATDQNFVLNSVFKVAAQHSMGKMMCDVLQQYDFSFSDYFSRKAGDDLLKGMKVLLCYLEEEKLMGDVLWKYVNAYVTEIKGNIGLKEQLQLLRLLSKIAPPSLDNQPDVQTQTELLKQLRSMAITDPHVSVMLKLAEKYVALRMPKLEARMVFNY